MPAPWLTRSVTSAACAPPCATWLSSTVGAPGPPSRGTQPSSPSSKSVSMTTSPGGRWRAEREGERPARGEALVDDGLGRGERAGPVTAAVVHEHDLAGLHRRAQVRGQRRDVLRLPVVDGVDHRERLHAERDGDVLGGAPAPLGARKNGTWRVRVAQRRADDRQVRDHVGLRLRCRPRAHVGEAVEWLHSVCPSATIRRRMSAPPGALMFWPMTQNMAWMSCPPGSRAAAGSCPGWGRRRTSAPTRCRCPGHR